MRKEGNFRVLNLEARLKLTQFVVILQCECIFSHFSLLLVFSSAGHILKKFFYYLAFIISSTS
jgi:hypothetical protein